VHRPQVPSSGNQTINRQVVAIARRVSGGEGLTRPRLRPCWQPVFSKTRKDRRLFLFLILQPTPLSLVLIDHDEPAARSVDVSNRVRGVIASMTVGCLFVVFVYLFSVFVCRFFVLFVLCTEPIWEF